MPIFNANGTEINTCFNSEGNSLSSAYDVNGTEIWTSGPTVYTIATYNVGDWGWGRGNPPLAKKDEYLSLQRTLFSQIDACICSMQEWSAVFCQDDRTRSSVVTDEFFQYLNGTGVWAIGSNIAFNSFGIYDYTTVTTGGDAEKYEKAYFTLNGKNVCLFNVHMSLNQAQQEAQCAEILNLAREEEYCIVCGDFNTVISSLTDVDYINCIKPFIDAGFTDANCGAFGIFPTYYATNDPEATYRPATDHILVSSNIDIINAYVNTTKLTDGLADKIDHVPLVAEIVIN